MINKGICAKSLEFSLTIFCVKAVVSFGGLRLKFWAGNFGRGRPKLIRCACPMYDRCALCSLLEFRPGLYSVSCRLFLHFIMAAKLPR